MRIAIALAPVAAGTAVGPIAGREGAAVYLGLSAVAAATRVGGVTIYRPQLPLGLDAVIGATQVSGLLPLGRLGVALHAVTGRTVVANWGAGQGPIGDAAPLSDNPPVFASVRLFGQAKVGLG